MEKTELSKLCLIHRKTKLEFFVNTKTLTRCDQEAVNCSKKLH